MSPTPRFAKLDSETLQASLQSHIQDLLTKTVRSAWPTIIATNEINAIAHGISVLTHSTKDIGMAITGLQWSKNPPASEIRGTAAK